MLQKIISLLLLLSFMLGISVPATAKKQPQEVLISASSERKAISENLYGLSLEGTTTALETGLYANFVYNSSFEELGPSATLPGWELFGAYTIETEEEDAKKRKYLILPEGKKQKIKNLGFCEENMQTKSKKSQNACKASMGIEAGEGYIFSAFMKNTNTIVTVCLENEKGEKLSETNTFIVTVGSQWEKFTFPLSAAKTDYGYLSIEFAGGPVSIDNVSLMPADSFGLKDANWQNAALRKDLYDALYDAHPSVLEIPVACSTKGNISSAPSWKRTIGPMTERAPVPSLTSEEALPYNNSRAIGLHEMLQLAENVGASAVPVISMDALYRVQPIQEATTETTTEEETTTEALKNDKKENKHKKGKEETEETTTAPALPTQETPEQKEKRFQKLLYMPGTQEMQNFLVDIFDMLSYAKIDSSLSLWGEKRVENGHEEPFTVTKMILDSQEVKDDAYLYAASYLKNVIETAYPDVQVLIASDFTSADIASAEEQAQMSTEETTTETEKNSKEENDSSSAKPSTPIQRKPATYAEWKEALQDENVIVLKGAPHQEDVKTILQAMENASVPTPFTFWSLSQYNEEENRHSKIQKNFDLSKALFEAKSIVFAEQHSDILPSVSFGPLFSRMDIPNAQSGLILFNAHASIRTPNFLVQQLFANHTGTHTINADVPESMEDLCQSVSIDEEKEVLYVKLVNTGDEKSLSYRLDGFDTVRYADVLSISNANAHAYNDIGNTRVHIQKNDATVSNSIPISIPKNSVSVLRIAYGSNVADENLYQLPKTVEPTRRYTTEEKTIFSSILAGVVGIVVLLYGSIQFYRYKKKNKQK